MVKGVEKEVEAKELLHDLRMKENLEKGFEVVKKTFDKVLEKFKKNNKRNYDFLIMAGDGFKDKVFHLCKRIIEEEQFPRSFDNTTLHQG